MARLACLALLSTLLLATPASSQPPPEPVAASTDYILLGVLMGPEQKRNEFGQLLTASGSWVGFPPEGTSNEEAFIACPGGFYSITLRVPPERVEDAKSVIEQLAWKGSFT